MQSDPIEMEQNGQGDLECREQPSEGEHQYSDEQECPCRGRHAAQQREIRHINSFLTGWVVHNYYFY